MSVEPLHPRALRAQPAPPGGILDRHPTGPAANQPSRPPYSSRPRCTGSNMENGNVGTGAVPVSGDGVPVAVMVMMAISIGEWSGGSVRAAGPRAWCPGPARLVRQRAPARRRTPARRPARAGRCVMRGQPFERGGDDLAGGERVAADDVDDLQAFHAEQHRRRIVEHDARGFLVIMEPVARPGIAGAAGSPGLSAACLPAHRTMSAPRAAWLSRSVLAWLAPLGRNRACLPIRGWSAAAPVRRAAARRTPRSGMPPRPPRSPARTYRRCTGHRSGQGCGAI